MSSIEAAKIAEITYIWACPDCRIKDDPTRHQCLERLVPRVDFKRSETYQELPTVMDKVLEDRGKRYGSFIGHAHVTQRLKKVIEDELAKRNKVLLPIHQEAIDMIMHKLGRIINGDENYDDSWIDICGYSQLVVDFIHGKLT